MSSNGAKEVEEHKGAHGSNVTLPVMGVGEGMVTLTDDRLYSWLKPPSAVISVPTM